MQYLGAEYRLSQVSEAIYSATSQHVAGLQGVYGLRGTLRSITKKEMSTLSDCIYTFGNHLTDVYGEGGGFYGSAFVVGIAALRQVNPQPDVPAVEAEDWDSMMGREAELRERVGSKTLEAIGGVGLLEIREVNNTYVEGYQAVMNTPNLSPYLGFTGLATLHAHDILHFASIRTGS